MAECRADHIVCRSTRARIAELEAALKKWRAQPGREVHDPWVVISAREIDDLLQKPKQE